MNLILLFTIASFIGAFTVILPSLLSGMNGDGKSLDSTAGSNLGYEEIIQVNVDTHGNLTVLGSFQGPQVNPDVNWSLPEYDYLFVLLLGAVNPNLTDYYYDAMQSFDPECPQNDVYLQLLFLTRDDGNMAMGMENPVVLGETEMIQAAETLKTDIEQAFGISNNFSATPVATGMHMGEAQYFIYAFNYSAQVDYGLFLQYFADHAPPGLADCFSTTRINDTQSRLEWSFSNNFQLAEATTSLMRNPFADYTSAFECNVYLYYPGYFGASYPDFSFYTFNLSDLIDTPLTPLSQLNESAYSTSEVSTIIENGKILSNMTSSYHIPRLMGLDHDWWLLQNATFYDTWVDGLGTVSDIQVNFTAPIVNTIFVSPSPGTYSGDVNIQLFIDSNITGWFYTAVIYDEATFNQQVFDDLSFYYGFPTDPLEALLIFGVHPNYAVNWTDTYRFPNGNYVIYVSANYNNLSSLSMRSRFGGGGAGVVYNYTRITLNNPGQITLDPLSLTPNEVLIKGVNITVNATSPASVLAVEYEVYNYSALMWGGSPMANGTLNWVASTIWNGTWDSTTIPSTEDYILRIKAYDLNNTFYRDVPITVNNTLYQENIPIYAPMGAHMGSGAYDIRIGCIEPPQLSDPFLGGGGGGPAPIMFFGYGVDFGIDFNSHLYGDVIGIFLMADNNHTNNPLWSQISEEAHDLDFGITIMMPDLSAQSQETLLAVLEEMKTAFNLPDMTYLDTQVMEMGPGQYAYFQTYGANYTTINYQTLINKFHSSVPAGGLAELYTTTNMTQSDLNSSMMFAWVNPDSAYGSLIYGSTPSVLNYNLGQKAFISPMIWIPNYFDSSLGSNWSVSLHDLFPQFSQFNACSPSVSNTIYSGFGPTAFIIPYGGIALNSNITDWYPYDPFFLNVTPIVGIPNPNVLGMVSYTMLDTSMVPFGLLTTDDIRFNFTGPLITNTLLGPLEWQSVELSDYNVTYTLQTLYGINETNIYYIPVGENQNYWVTPEFNGNNWTKAINSTSYPPGPYRVLTYVRDQLENWAINQTFIYMNNSIYTSSLIIRINDWGDVVLSGGGFWGGDFFFGYGVDMGLDLSMPEYNDTTLGMVYMEISQEDDFNELSYAVTEENWNVIIFVEGSWPEPTDEELKEVATPIIADLERVFDVPGQFQYVEEHLIGPPHQAWVMNYTTSNDYDYFLDHYETFMKGNLSNVFSKENMLKANQSCIWYFILPEYVVREDLAWMGYPTTGNIGDHIYMAPIMHFEDVYDYTALNQTHNFSLADLLGISQINTDYEQGMTYSQSTIITQIQGGNYTDVYPNIPGYTTYTPFSMPSRYEFLMQTKQGPMQMGINWTDDIRFNFTAPYTLLDILSPIEGSTVHGDVELIVNATTLAPSITDIAADIYLAGTLSDLLGTSPLATITLTYDPVGQFWNATWETHDATFTNGWYDIIFWSQDSLGRPQRNITRVCVHNTFYTEDLQLIIDQGGNITATFQCSGNTLGVDYNASIPEYQETVLTTFMITNTFSGSQNYSSQILTEWLDIPDNDFGLSVMVPSDKTEAEALLIASPIKDDYERILGIEGNLSYLHFGPFFMPMPGMEDMNLVFFGSNYTPSVNFNYFVDHVHQSIPSGMNNSLPASTLATTDCFFQWVTFSDPAMAPGGAEGPNMQVDMTSLLMGIFFFPEYYGANYMTTPATHNLSLATLFNVPQFAYASTDVADTVYSRAYITTENANITSWYPDIPGMTRKNPDEPEYEVTLAMKNPYDRGAGQYQFTEVDIGVDDVNVTFDTAMTRATVVTPLPGAIIDGNTTVRVFVENSTPVKSVTFKVYTEAELDFLAISNLFGGEMPDSRFPGIYGQGSMIEEGGGYWNYTWLAYQQADGPVWFEIVVGTEDDFYVYNTTEVTIANSNPLAINVLSPSDGASMSGMMQLSAQVINSTPVNQVVCTVYSASPSIPLSTIPLEAQGGGVYSGYYGTHGLVNGTYNLLFNVSDTYGAIAYNDSVAISVLNPTLFEIALLYPTSKLNWSSSAEISALGTGPYHTKIIYYKITQQYYHSGYNYWSSRGTMAEGFMVDPDSTWEATIDTSMWSALVEDGGEWYEAYYLIELTGTDTGYAEATYSERFPLSSPANLTAEINNPNDWDTLSGIAYVNVTTLDGTPFTEVYGRVLRGTDDYLIQELNFTITGPGYDAFAPVYTYIHENIFYDIEVWGITGTGAFLDSVRVDFWNDPIFTMECINPGPSDTVTGLITVQLDITNVTPLTYIWAEIRVPDGPWEARLDSFVYNSTTGYWEQPWYSTEVADGNYDIDCGCKDSNDIEVYYKHRITINNPPNVTILEPAPASNYDEYENIHFVVQIPDRDVDHLELWAEGDYIMNFTKSAGENWTADWSDTIGYYGAVLIQVFAYDIGGQVNDTEWIGISINKTIPPAGRADIYNGTTTYVNGTPQTTFVENDTVEYHATIRGDAGNSTYHITAHTDDPNLQGYLEYTENVTVTAGQDLQISFNYTIATGAPTGTYTVWILIWTEWPWNGGICVDFIIITFEVV